MKILSWLLATLFLSPLTIAVFGEYAKADPPPSTFNQTSRMYRFARLTIVDLDKMLAELGIKVYACRLDNGSIQRYRGVGACLYESVNYTFKEERSSTIWLWVLNEKNQYLPPLKLEWKTRHTNWPDLIGEFAFLSFENILGHFAKKSNQVVSEKGASACTTKISSVRDLGNFIGDILITFPKGRKVSEYFVIKKLDGLDVHRISLHATTPFFLNKKRAYKIQATVQSDNSESLHIVMLTNFNLVSRRDSCFKGSIQRMSTDPAVSQLP